MIHTCLCYTISDSPFLHYNTPIYTGLPRSHTDIFRLPIPEKRNILVFILHCIGFTISPLHHTDIYRFTTSTYWYIPSTYLTHSWKTICTSFYTILYRIYRFIIYAKRYILVFILFYIGFTISPLQNTDIYRFTAPTYRYNQFTSPTYRYIPLSCEKINT